MYALKKMDAEFLGQTGWVDAASRTLCVSCLLLDAVHAYTPRIVGVISASISSHRRSTGSNLSSQPNIWTAHPEYRMRAGHWDRVMEHSISHFCRVG